jgi:hypothetical protein
MALITAEWLNQKLPSSNSTTIYRLIIFPRDQNTRSLYEAVIKRRGWSEFDFNEIELFAEIDHYSEHPPNDDLTLFAILRKHDSSNDSNEFRRELLINLILGENLILPLNVVLDRNLL